MITKVSEITIKDIADFIRLGEVDSADEIQLQTFLTASKGYIRSYTGLKDEEINELPEMVVAVYVLCQDMYDNRTLYVDSNNPNKVVQTILDMHTVNNIC